MAQFRQPPLTQIPSHVAALTDYEPLAQARLNEAAWAYFSGGAADEHALQRNTQSFQRYELLPTVLKDLSQGNTVLRLLGRERPYPIILAPVAFQRMAHSDGELATVLAASAMQATTVVSMQASCTVEALAAKAHEPLWFQWYHQPDSVASKHLLRRVEDAGYEAIVMTVDAHVSGIRNREQRARFSLPPGVAAINLREFHAEGVEAGAPGSSPVFGSGLVRFAATWEDLDW